MGANLGNSAVPIEWVEILGEWPRNVNWMEQVAMSLTANLAGEPFANQPPMRWLATLPRNAIFAVVVLGIGFRRLFPPY